MRSSVQPSALLKIDKENTPSLPVSTPEGATVGWLEPINSANAHRSEIVASLYHWRKDNMTCFLTVFEPSQEKTRHYLDQIYLPDVERILFLVREHNLLVGHLGFKNLGTKEPKLDYVLRGEPCGLPALMHLSQIAALAWIFGKPDINTVVLEVLEQNERAIRAYQKVGFQSSMVTDLVRVPIEGGYVLTPVTDSQRNSASERLLTMEIDRASFVRNHGWALT